MKLLFVSAKSKKFLNFYSIPFNSIFSNFLNIGIISTIQFSNLIPELKKALEKNKKKVVIYKNPNVLGCNTIAVERIQGKVDAFVFLSSGEFHVLNNINKIKKPIFQLNPITGQFTKFDSQKKESIKQKQRIIEKKFILARNIGILITTKPGQQQLKQSINLKKQLENKGKKVFMFIFNNLDLNQFENFPEIKLYINTACPGLILDSDKIINLEQVRALINK